MKGFASPDEKLRSSRIPDSAPGVWSEKHPLRECAVWCYPEEHLRILREIFPALYTFYLEEDLYLERPYSGSLTKGQLRAAMLDLRYTARYLAMVARQSVNEESARDRQLSDFADRLALQVEKLADLIERQIVPKRRRKGGVV